MCHFGRQTVSILFQSTRGWRTADGERNGARCSKFGLAFHQGMFEDSTRTPHTGSDSESENVCKLESYISYILEQHMTWFRVMSVMRLLQGGSLP